LEYIPKNQVSPKCTFNWDFSNFGNVADIIKGAIQVKRISNLIIAKSNSKAEKKIALLWNFNKCS